jgi:hypothetical protein
MYKVYKESSHNECHLDWKVKKIIAMYRGFFTEVAAVDIINRADINNYVIGFINYLRCPSKTITAS